MKGFVNISILVQGLDFTQLFLSLVSVLHFRMVLVFGGLRVVELPIMPDSLQLGIGVQLGYVYLLHMTLTCIVVLDSMDCGLGNLVPWKLAIQRTFMSRADKCQSIPTWMNSKFSLNSPFEMFVRSNLNSITTETFLHLACPRMGSIYTVP